MDIYLVGGAVRDALLARDAGTTAHVDRDWVVVGATPEAMQEQGFLPVGRDFPVFLHPQTREEYALARTERKTSPGYHGFAFHAAPGVTLEDDLARRDLTINAMAVAQAEAEHPERATLIDPYHGQRDLRERVLRHVTGAFAEDPVRILRLARFAARFPDFSVAPETLALMRHMVDHGEVDHLVPERVWQELSRGLMEQRPSRLLEVLRSCGALQRLLPEVDRLWGVPQRAESKSGSDSNFSPSLCDESQQPVTGCKKLESDPDLLSAGVHLMMVLDMSARLAAPLSVRFACLCHDLGKGTTAADVLPRHIGHEERSARLLKGVCERWRVPRECRELADVVAREHGNIHRSADLNATALLRLLERCDALRRPERFIEVLLACECDARGRLGFENSAYPQRERLLWALGAASAVDPEPLAAQITASLPPDATAQARAQLGPRIAHTIHTARAQAVAAALNAAASPATSV